MVNSSQQQQIPLDSAQGRLSLGLPHKRFHPLWGPRRAEAQDDKA